MKAPATRSAKSTKTVTTAAKGRASQTSKPAGKPVAKPVAKKAVAASKTVAKAAAKPAVKAAPKAKLPAKPVVKPVIKTAAKTAAKPVSKVAAKVPAPVAGKAPAKAVVKAPKSAPVKAAVPKAQARVEPPRMPQAPKPVTLPAAPAVAVVEPPVRPAGKRAIKKAMMEQMSQATAQPSHAPDAAKATFFTMNERVMTPPAPPSIQKDPKRANNWKKLSVEELADQDITAMPDAEYMNDVQLAFFRRKLSQLKADMLANAGETTEHLREDTVVVPDPADRATIEEEHALELRTRDRERKLLKKIEQAIARIDSGDYGYCEETGEPIGVGRLMARPTASLSLEAQQRRELKQKMFGD